MNFTYEEVKSLLEFFGEPDPDWPEMEITVVENTDGENVHSGPGKYAYYTEYPEEGAIKLYKLLSPQFR